MSQRFSRTQRGTVKVALAALVAASSLSGVVYALGAHPETPTAHSATNNRLLNLTPRPARRAIVAGTATTYRIHVRRDSPLVRARRDGNARRAALIWLKVTSKLPAGLTAKFAPRSTRSRLARLTLSTTAAMKPGTYHVYLQGRGRRVPVKPYLRRYAHTVVTLNVAAPIHRALHSFAIRGSITGLLSPGAASPVSLSITNAQDSALEVRWLSVSLASVQAPAADASHPCSTDDFQAVQFSGTYGFDVPQSSTLSLAALGVPAAHWPWVFMRNRATNQDGCKGASLTLKVTGLGFGAGG